MSIPSGPSKWPQNPKYGERKNRDNTSLVPARISKRAVVIAGTVVLCFFLLLRGGCGDKTPTHSEADNGSSSPKVDDGTRPPPALKSTVVSVSSSPNPSRPGEPITLTATVTPQGAAADARPSGRVSFQRGSETIGTALLDGSTATLRVAAREIPANVAITAHYEGDSVFAGHQSDGHEHRFARRKSVTQLRFNPSAVAGYHQRVEFSIQVRPFDSGADDLRGIFPTGTVILTMGKETRELLLHDEGLASWRTAELPIGDLDVAATYHGDQNYEGSQSESSRLSINKAETRTSLTMSTGSSPLEDQTVKLQVKVSYVPVPASSRSPEGAVEFYENGEPLLITRPVVGGMATLERRFRRGPHRLEAVFVPSEGASVAGSRSGVTEINVRPSRLAPKPR